VLSPLGKKRRANESDDDGGLPARKSQRVSSAASPSTTPPKSIAKLVTPPRSIAKPATPPKSLPPAKIAKLVTPAKQPTPTRPAETAPVTPPIRKQSTRQPLSREISPLSGTKRPAAAASSASVGDALKGCVFWVTRKVPEGTTRQNCISKNNTRVYSAFDRAAVEETIKANGGTVVPEKSLVIREGVKTFCVADEPARTKKYLVALAAAIPCVSYTFIDHAVEAGSTDGFVPYLLEAGHSFATNRSGSQSYER